MSKYCAFRTASGRSMTARTETCWRFSPPLAS
jgi:hypothetical protein